MARTLQAKEWNRTSEQELNQNFPLHRACRDGDIDALLCLLQQKDSAALHLSLEDTYYGWTPLHWACYFGKPECLQLLLKSSDGNVPDIKTSVYNQTPTHIAAFTGHSECLQILIEAKSDLDCQDYLGETPLHKASRSGSIECVKRLLNNKANYAIKNSNEKTPAELAQTFHQMTVVNLFSFMKHEGTPSGPLISSNGYYGYQRLNNSETNLSNELDNEMETDDSSLGFPRKVIPECKNGIATANGHTHVMNKDITISEEFSQNKIAVAGKKRSREESIPVPQMKRIRTEGTFPFHSSSYPMNQRLPLNNISNQFKNEICECSVRKLSSEKENIKFNFTGLNKSRHGENFNQVFYWSSSVTISGNEETLPTFESKDHFNFGENQSLASELLRETHGCESYLLLRESP